MTENDFLLQDRLGVIKDTISKYGEDNFYLSFSGGKDSTVVHYLLDMAIPGNKYPRVFINTGIEYNAIVEFVMELAKQDKRFVIIQPSKNIKKILEKVGYPFKSKEHSQKVMEYQKSGIKPHIERYLKKKDFGCPDILKYQFTKECHLKISHLCCTELKKKPVKEWEKKTNRHIGITGMRAEEGGIRGQLGCILTKQGKVHRFNPLIKVSDEWEEWFIKEHQIKLCKLYGEPYNFQRTGCKGCPFSLSLSQQLETMEKYFPNERKQMEIIWKPVYDEYRRLDYRLKKTERIRLL